MVTQILMRTDAKAKANYQYQYQYLYKHKHKHKHTHRRAPSSRGGATRCAVAETPQATKEGAHAVFKKIMQRWIMFYL